MAFRVEVPSPCAGIGSALRDAYRLPPLPIELTRLLARIR
jgi:hypothetical protein